MEAEIVELIKDLNEAEKLSLDDVGPITQRMHKAIVALCKAFGIENLWDKDPCLCDDTHILTIESGEEIRIM